MPHPFRITATVLACAAMMAAGSASAYDRDRDWNRDWNRDRGRDWSRDRDRDRDRHGQHRRGDGPSLGAVLGIGLGLLVGAAVLSAVTGPSKPEPAPASANYAGPQAPYGYCYSNGMSNYVPCPAQPATYYGAPSPYVNGN
ncbi:hypothetical protein BKK79_31600 [Cupriavidus sp. USMAA2-4]|uniref:hypothetical protein n=1 Tax=Cupriavidus sp. USMAA2-4 TaxID=876364 RepID=UPI0008A6DA5A|nr:hypothetical protein [Cupriavidus sp. USMAA2-4]AOY96170.1 hypothetical protein BKK79_31600 [Cupriavidus sp. USMAA2-4]